MASEENNPRVCSQCGSAIESEQQGTLCAVCAISAAEAVVASKQQGSALGQVERESRVRRRVPVRLLVAICLACLGVIAWTAPEFVQATGGHMPIRVGTQTTEGRCDECVANLWQYSQAMGFDDPMPRLACPASGEPYVVTGSVADGTLAVACPTPEAHGLSSLRVKWDQRMPEAEK